MVGRYCTVLKIPFKNPGSGHQLTLRPIDALAGHASPSRCSFGSSRSLTVHEPTTAQCKAVDHVRSKYGSF